MKPGKDYIGVGCGALIFNDKNELLLMKRSKKIEVHHSTVNMWSTPGGEVEFQEKIEDAVKREVREELGVEIEIIKFIGFNDQILKKAGVHWTCHEFMCKIKSGEPKNMEPKKCDELRWFKINDIPKNCGIAHIITPLYQLGLITKEEYEKRVKETDES